MSSNIQTDDDSTASDTPTMGDPDSELTFYEKGVSLIMIGSEFDDPEVIAHAWWMWKQDRSQITKFIDAYREVCLNEGESESDAEE